MTVTALSEPEATPRPARSPIGAADWAMLAAVLVPIAVAVITAWRDRWTPEQDAGWFTARALDVLTARHPFVGAWSTPPRGVSDSPNNLGPLQLLLLAPFVRVSPWLGTAAGVAAVNAAAVAAVWWTARDLLGRSGRLLATVATLLVLGSFGARALVDPRQQVALLVPFWALLWLTAAAALGRRWAALAWLLTASLVAQTHFSYGYLVAALALVAVVGYLASTRDAWPTTAFRRDAAIAAVVTTLLWAHTFWDQIAGSGNLGSVVGRAFGRGETGAGWAIGVRILGDSPMSPPLWSPTRVAQFRWPYSSSTGWSVLLVALWTGALVLAVTTARRRHDRTVVALGTVGLAGVGGAWWTAASIGPTAFGLLPQNYFWLWPLSVFQACAVGVAFVRSRARPPWARAAASVVGVAAVIGAGVYASADRLSFPQWSPDDHLAAVTGRSVLDGLDRALTAEQRTTDLGDAVLVVETSSRGVIPDYYAILGELTRHGIDVHFPAGSDNLRRFGRSRCVDGTERYRLVTAVATAAVPLGPDDRLLFRGGGLSDEDQGELLDARGRVVDAVATGRVSSDPSALEDDGYPGAATAAFLADPAAARDDVWLAFAAEVRAGAVGLPASVADDYARWIALEQARLGANLTVYLTPNLAPAECHD